MLYTYKTHLRVVIVNLEKISDNNGFFNLGNLELLIN